MQAIEVLNGHELADLTSEEQLFEAADLNGIGITDALTPGVVLSIPEPLLRKVNSPTVTLPEQTISVKVEAGQVMIDLALQQLGDEHRLFELADLNDKGITDEPTVGTYVKSPLAEASKRRLVNTMKKAKPSSLYFGVGNPEPEGIGYWIIEYDFKVS